ncbi:MAG: beta-galactosidase, partial [Planctomycetota bacterium]|nr:beta-galactosidase [Planctomycetota bacterium]
MASITYDSQSFLIDGRRRWLCAGVVDSARVARDQWSARLRAAKQCGLNTVVVPVHWRRHEPSQGKFDFKGDCDIAEFIRLAGAEGLFVVVRTGPAVDSTVEMGGMPAWLLEHEGMRLRAADPAFLEAAAKFIGALTGEIRELQVTSRKSGPILLVQNEHQWFCGEQEANESYLFELGRFLRENGISVPIINNNNLYQRVEGEIDGWEGIDGLHGVLRQLRSIQRDAPLLVTGLQIGKPDVWGQARPAQLSAGQTVHRLAQALAAHGQFVLSPFHGGTNFGFSGGRAAFSNDSHFTTSNDAQAPLGEAGGRGALYSAVKRIATFATSFERVFAGLDS